MTRERAPADPDGEPGTVSDLTSLCRGCSGEGYEVDRNVAYGTAANVPLLLDVYCAPDRAASRPAIVLVHGGGM